MRNEIRTQKDCDDALRSMFAKKKKRYHTQIQQPINSRRDLDVGIDETPIRNGQPPKTIHSNPPYERKPKPIVIICQLQKRTVRTLKHLMVVSIMLTIGVLMMSMPSDPTMITSSSMFVPVVMAFIGIFFAWKFLSNQLVWQINIVPNRYTARKPKEELPNTNIPMKEEQPVAHAGKEGKTIEAPIEEPRPVVSKEMPNRMNANAVSYTIILGGLIVFGMLVIWSIDMSVTALMLQGQGLGAQLSNGFRIMDAAQQYHVSVGALIVVMMLFFYIALRIQQENKPKTSRRRLHLNLKLPESTILKKPHPVVFNMISSFLVLPLVGFMALTFMLASANPQYIVIHEFNRFGEGFPELIMVNIIFGIAIINARWSMKLYRTNRNKWKNEK